MTSQGTPVQSLGQVVGRNVQELRNRAGWTQVEFTSRCQQLGLSWHRPKVSALESGAGATHVTLTNLILLALALDAEPSDLLKGEEDVQLTPHFRCSLPDLRGYLRGDGPPTLRQNQPAAVGPAAVLDVDPPLEVEMAAKFDVGVREIQNSARNMFEGKTLTEKRDAEMLRLGPLTKEQRTTHRGHVMRRLTADIEADLRRRGVVH